MGGSIVTLPDAPNVRWWATAPADRGRVESLSLRSELLRNSRTLKVYIPAGFQPDHEYDVMVVLDEDVYSGPVPLATILDSLIAERRARPVIGVLVGNNEREVELSCSASFSGFLATELLPWVENRYRFRRRRERTTIAGSSLGGLAAACAGLQAAHQFGNAIALSGSFRWRPRGDSEPEWPARQFALLPAVPIRFFIGVGSHETGTPGEPGNPSLLTASRHMRDVLRAKGYTVKYLEFPGAHEPLSWRAAIAQAIMDMQ
jgi:enterochelin esterase family protein